MSSALRIRRAPTIGRASQASLLEDALGGAIEGVPGVVVVEGVAGIGKSRLVREFAADAQRSGARALLGTCQADVWMPYHALAEAFDHLLAAPPTGAAPEDLDAVAGCIGSAAAWSGPDPRPGAGSSGTVGLFLATARLLLAAARTRPTVLVIDDLHWADPATLDLLGHVAVVVADEAVTTATPLLILVSHRPVPNDGQVRSVIDKMTRELDGSTTTLEGLDELGVTELVAALSGTRPSPTLVSALDEHCEGNPYMVETVLRRLVASDAIEVVAGDLRLRPGRSVSPAGSTLDAELGTRIDAVSRQCRQMLAMAALVGDGSSTEWGAAADLEAAPLRELLQEGADAGLVIVDGEHCMFAHPQVRQVLVHAHPTVQVARDHVEIADRLEPLATAGSARAAALVAQHLRAGAAAADPARVLAHVLPAGNAAFARCAWVEAARYYDSALEQACHVDAVTPAERLAMLCSAAEAHVRQHDYVSAVQRCEVAAGLARTIGDVARLGYAELLADRARWFHGAVATTVGSPSALQRLIEEVGSDHPGLQARAEAQLAERCFIGGDFDTGADHGERARALAAAEDDDDLTARAEFAAGLIAMGRLHLDEAELAFRRSRDAARRLDDVWLDSWGQGRLPLVLLMRGELERASTEVADAAAEAGAHHDWAEMTLAAGIRAAIATAAGRTAETERAVAAGVRAYTRSSYGSALPLLYPARACVKAACGDAFGAHAAIDALERDAGIPAGHAHVLVDAVCGTGGGEVPRPVSPAVTPNLFTLALLASQAEVASITRDEDMAAACCEALERLVDSGVMWSPFWPIFLPRVLVFATRARRCWADAAARLDQAIRIATSTGARVELARLRVEAVLLRRDGPGGGDSGIEESRQLLTAAAATFDDLGLMSYLRVAQAHSGADPELWGRERVIFFSDIEGSTRMIVRTGDRRWLQLLSEHDQVVRDRLVESDGVEFKHTGDGICAWFASAESAVRCALAVQSDMERRNAGHVETPLVIKIGLAAGRPLAVGSDLFGLAVSTASRVCEQAGGGRVLATTAVRDAAGDAATFESIGPAELKGLPEPTELHVAVAVRPPVPAAG